MTVAWRVVPIAEMGGTRVLFRSMHDEVRCARDGGSNMVRADIEKMMAAALARLDRPG